MGDQPSVHTFGVRMTASSTLAQARRNAGPSGALTAALWLGTAACAGPSPSVEATATEATASHEDVFDAGGQTLDPALWEGLPVHYDIRADPTLGQVSVTATFRGAPAPFPLALPPRSHQGSIRDLRAQCGDETLTVELGAQRKLSIRHEGCPVIQLNYQVSTGVHGPPAARLDRDIFSVRGPKTLILPDLPAAQMAEMGAFAVAIHAPKRWKVATNWTPVEVKETDLEPLSADLMAWHYIADDIGHLQDSVVVAGDLEIWASTLADGRVLQVATGPGVTVDRSTLETLVERTAEAQRDYLPMGWIWPRGTGRLSMIVLGSEHPHQVSGGGHRGGFVVEAGREVSRVELAELIAHETFHVLNGHLLVHRPDQEYQTLWFKEGVTTYVAARTVVRAGLADEAWFRHRMSDLATKYYGNPLSMKLPSTAMETWFWRDPHARRLPYDKGALIGLILDAQLSGHGGHSGLATLIAELLLRARDGEPYDTDALHRAVAACPTRSADFDVDAFWSRFVDGIEPLPLDLALSKLDLHLVRATERAPYFGIQVSADDWGPFVAEVDPLSSAGRAGLRVGDRLAADPRLERLRTLAPAALDVIRSGAVSRIVLQPEQGRREAYRLQPVHTASPPRYLMLLRPTPTRREATTARPHLSSRQP